MSGTLSMSQQPYSGPDLLAVEVSVSHALRNSR